MARCQHCYSKPTGYRYDASGRRIRLCERHMALAPKSFPVISPPGGREAARQRIGLHDASVVRDLFWMPWARP